MAYYLTIESKRDEYIPIDIKNSIYFQTLKRKYEKPCAYSLEEIDSFTMMFDNDEEFRHTLISEGLLPIKMHDKKLSIRFLRKGKYEKIRYDFLYQKDLEYIANPQAVVEYVMKKYYQNDFVFLQKFASTFSSFYECSTTAPEVLQSSSISIREGHRHYLLESIDKNGDFLVSRLVKLLILKHTEFFDGTINYRNEANYRNLHSVIAFINHYNTKISKETEKETYPEKKEQEITLEQVTFSDYIFQSDVDNTKNIQSIQTSQENQTKTIEVKTKTRSKKKIEVLDGQLGFKI